MGIYAENPISERGRGIIGCEEATRSLYTGVARLIEERFVLAMNGRCSADGTRRTSRTLLSKTPREQARVRLLGEQSGTRAVCPRTRAEFLALCQRHDATPQIPSGREIAPWPHICLTLVSVRIRGG